MMRGGGGESGLEAGENGGGLARLPSIYSLTFDELQSTLGGPGKDFGSMNMDELLKSIWTAEESQAMAAAAAAGGLQGQGSLTLPRTLSQKTVDEVWRDLTCPAQQGPPPTAGVPHQRRQPTLGEMTLEEFLVRTGVVREELAPPSAASPQRPIGNSINKNTTSNVLFGDLTAASNTAGLTLGFAQAGQSGRDVIVTNPIANSAAANLAMMAAAGPSPYVAPLSSRNGVVDMGNAQGTRGGGLVGIGDANGLMPRSAVGFGAAGGMITVGTPANHLPSDALRKGGGDPSSSVSPAPYVFSRGLRGKKSSAVEKVLERRQRRMIKNRESAARSRARKQAYTMELEAEVAKLKELNEELQKKHAELIEMHKNQVLEMINQQQGPKKICLRRTETVSW